MRPVDEGGEAAVLLDGGDCRRRGLAKSTFCSHLISGASPSACTTHTHTIHTTHTDGSFEPVDITEYHEAGGGGAGDDAEAAMQR